MPPKGWKKNGDPNAPQPYREADLVSIDDILFPRSTLQKLAKAILSDDENHNSMSLAKDAQLALQRSSTVFVSYLLFHAKSISKETGRKTVNAQDMMGALERAEFGGFVPELKQKLSAFEATTKLKKQKKAEEKAAVEAPAEEKVYKKPKLHDGGITLREPLIEPVDSDDSDEEDLKSKEKSTENKNEEAGSDEDVDLEEAEAEEVEVEDNDDDDDEGEEEEEEEEEEVNPIAASSKEGRDLEGEEMQDDDSLSSGDDHHDNNGHDDDDDDDDDDDNDNDE
ncbi:uncharacterized protein LODBEIA_P45330 [Lodderomyces beijingensis]|uniref:DNA polymerase epsilon subunit D n=1 Tax=Lodderomyces beijingensis TaxID=1775926 RepID=A0ABP0ZQW9_9ASCO